MSDDNPWHEETVARLRELWAEGHSTSEIGLRLGVSKNAVIGKAHRLDLPARPSPLPQPPYPLSIDWDKVSALIAAGRTPEQAAVYLGIKPGTLRAYAQRARLRFADMRPMRPPRRRHAPTAKPRPSPPPVIVEAPMIVADQRQQPMKLPVLHGPQCLWTDGEPGAWLVCEATCVPRGDKFGPFCERHAAFNRRCLARAVVKEAA